MYQVRPSQEIVWAIINGVAVAIAQILVNFQPETITDWKIWIITGIGAVVRAVGISILAALGKARLVKSDPLVEAAGG